MDMISKLLKDCKEKRDILNRYPSKLSTMLKPLTVWVTTNCGKFLEMEIPDQLTCLLRHLCES